MNQVFVYQNWTGSQASDTLMNNAHQASWQGMIDLVSEHDLSQSTILDFGCNQGGFLRFLYRQRRFQKAVGVDLASASIDLAAASLKGEPIVFETQDVWRPTNEEFDLAFSHEVIYLLPDLHQHAQQINGLLGQDGVYYIAIGAHSDNSLWARWRSIVAEFSPVAPQDYSLDDIALAFSHNGFHVQAQKMICRDFIDFAPANRYYASLKEKLDYYTNDFVLFRCMKRR